MGIVLGIVVPVGNGWALFLSGAELSLVGSCPRTKTLIGMGFTTGDVPTARVSALMRLKHKIVPRCWFVQAHTHTHIENYAYKYTHSVVSRGPVRVVDDVADLLVQDRGLKHVGLDLRLDDVADEDEDGSEDEGHEEMHVDHVPRAPKLPGTKRRRVSSLD